ncbi:hypothetical protein SDC9_182071 [bioreactor metagenome]|uniref:Uncharacterized protein n=1 Tax=bioreactor metagenome TaxID=1076179 RepID=A0A645H6C2_9ZZZZ
MPDLLVFETGFCLYNLIVSKIDNSVMKQMVQDEVIEKIRGVVFISFFKLG